MLPPTPVPRRVRLAVLGVALASFVAGFLVAGTLFPLQSGNDDEAVYRFQAEVIAEGHLTLPAAPHADFFRPWMSGFHDDRLVLVFQPVFPATLALSDRLFGTMHVAVAAITAGCVLVMFAFARTVTGDDRVALGSAVVLALSPLTLVHSGLVLQYLFAVLLELGVLTLVLRAAWDRPRLRLAGAGLLHGLLFAMRPLDAIVLGVVVVVLVVPRPSSWRPPVTALATIAVGALPGVLLTLAYNHVVTGHVLRFPLWAIGGENDLGFGERFIVAGAPVIDFGPNDAWIAIRQNLRSFPHWMAGGVLAVPVGAYGLWTLRKARAFPALVALAVLFPVAYLFYWGNILIVFGRRTIGPHYYLALLIPGALAVAAGVDALARRRGRVVALGVLAALGIATAIEIPDKVDRNLAVTDVRRAEDDTIEAAVGDRAAVVVLPIAADGPYVLHPRGWLANDPDLSDRVLYAADRLGQNVELFDRFPDREIWRFQAVEDARGARRPDMARLRIVAIDEQRRVPVTFRNTDGSPVLVATIVAGDERASCVLTRTGRIGDESTLPLLISSTSVTFPCPGAPVQVALPAGAFTLAVGAAFGPNEDTGFSRIHEYRLWGRRAAATELVAPAERWTRDATPTFRWRVTEGDPSIDLSLG